MEPVKIAIVGLGWISRSFVLPAYSRFSDVEIVALCDVNREAAKSLAGEYGIKKAVTDYKTIPEAVKPDGVIVAVPPQLTAEIGTFFLNAGISTYLEKPPGVTLAEAQQLGEAALNARAMVAFNRRFMPLVKKIREVIDEKGPLKQLSFEFYKSPDTDPSAQVTAYDPLVSTIIHGVDLLRVIAGEPVKVTSAVQKVGLSINNSFNALLHFDNGVQGTMNTCWGAGGRLERYTFHGAGYTVIMESPDEIRLLTGKKTDVIGPDPVKVGGIEGAELPGFTGGFPQELRHFIDSIREDTVPASTMQDALKTMELIDRIRGQKA